MVHRILAALAIVSLSACGGGGSGPQVTAAVPSAAAAPATNSPATAPSPSSNPSSAVTPAASPAPSAAPAPGAGSALAASTPTTVNAITAGMQTMRSIDPLASGGYAVSWSSQDSSGATALYVQRYDAQAAPSGGQPQIAYAAVAQENPAIAVLRDGSVLVVSAQSRPAWTVFARRFDASGAQIGAETIIASRPQGAFAQPVVTALDDGGFVAGWASVEDPSGTVLAQHAQRFDASMQAAGSPVDFAAVDANRNVSLRLVAAPGGNFVAGVTHRFNGIGYLQYRIGSTTVGALDDANAGMPELNTTLLALADGRFALWSTGSGGGYLQMLDASGRAMAPAGSVAVLPETAVDLADGGWATVTRQLRDQPYLAQRFNVSGQPMGASVVLTADVARPLGASTVSGGFAFAWTAATPQGDTDVKAVRVSAP